MKLLLEPVADFLRHREFRQAHELLQPFGFHLDLFIILNALDSIPN